MLLMRRAYNCQRSERLARLGRTGDLIVIVRGRRQLRVLSISTCIGRPIARAHVATQVGSLSSLRRFGLGCIGLALVCLWLQVPGEGRRAVVLQSISLRQGFEREKRHTSFWVAAWLSPASPPLRFLLAFRPRVTRLYTAPFFLTFPFLLYRT